LYGVKIMIKKNFVWKGKFWKEAFFFYDKKTSKERGPYRTLAAAEKAVVYIRKVEDYNKKRVEIEKSIRNPENNIKASLSKSLQKIPKGQMLRKIDG